MRIIISIITALVAVTAFSQTPADSIADSAGATQPERNVVMLPPLFEYPMAPDDLPDIRSRGNWIMENFWNPLDFGQTSVGQQQLNHAFYVWTAALRWADAEVVESSIDNLLKRLQGNPTLLYQFTKAAEANLYMDKAEMWVDGVYLRFIDALLANKKIDKLRKTRYQAQRRQLVSSMTGSRMPAFAFVTPDGAKGRLEVKKPYTIVEFGDPFCTDCMMYKVKLDTSPKLKRMLDAGKIDIYYIVPDGESVEGWQRQLADLPEGWVRGAGTALDDDYDIRMTPSVYLLDAQGRILGKFLTVEQIESMIEEPQ